jgi:hypothetical protein
MRLSRFVTAVSVSLLIAAAANAAHVDMNDPRRALGREDNIRIDAELLQDSLSPSSSLSVTYQVENLTQQTIGVADKITDVSFDPDTATVTFAIGAEVPTGTAMPHVATIPPGQKRVLSAGGMLHIAVPTQRTPWSIVPRYVQIKVNVLRDVTPFTALLAQQAKSAVAPALPGDLFDKWVDVNDAVFLNSIPVHWTGRGADDAGGDVAERTTRRGH